ncbi:MAG: divalent-cation tolerance protein CutA [Anaerolineales bacterium]|jgi:periplasmic divalent cation tolerance protein|nr:divalent-cation tolerance protein CutA [Anaerolineales bacterium]
MTDPIVVLITAPSKEVGKQIARVLLEQELAACVNIISSIDSIYTWEGKICNDEEVLLVVKSRAELFENQLVPAVQAIHPYRVPEIIALPIKMGAKSYLDWIEAVTKRT